MKHLLLTYLLLVFSLTAFAQQKQYGTTVAKYNVLPNNYNFWLHTPEDYSQDNTHRFPLVLFLHGRSLSGSDLNRVRRYGVIDAIEKGKYVPAIVIAPQSRGGWNPDKLNLLLNWVSDNYRVDTTRIYVIGMSMGGYGTMDFVSRYPQRVAAAMAFCGGCSYTSFDALGDVPLWIMHGTADRAVSVSCSQKVVDRLKSIGKDQLLRYDWLSGGSHGVYARMFYLQKTYDWLFSHTTLDNPRTVDRSFDINKSDIDETYDELKWFQQNQFEDE